MSAFLLINYVCLNVLVRIVSGVDVYICVLKSMCSGLGELVFLRSKSVPSVASGGLN